MHVAKVKGKAVSQAADHIGIFTPMQEAGLQLTKLRQWECNTCTSES